MRHADCIELLRWALPKMDLRWAGFRRVNGQVCKRIARRIAGLGLPGLDAYRTHLLSHPEEWGVLDALCRIHISRFYRDRGVFDALRDRILPDLAAQAVRNSRPALRVWSAGCAAGEEPYTLALVWHLALQTQFPALRFEVVATDVDPDTIERARAARYRHSSLKELPAGWLEASFQRDGDLHRLRDELRAVVEFRCQDIRAQMPEGPFDLILCRNSVFTYFADRVQEQLTAGLVGRLVPGGWLVVGSHERVPALPPAVNLAPAAHQGAGAGATSSSARGCGPGTAGSPRR
jgi:chemotaxis protein methyltransferase CheR